MFFFVTFILQLLIVPVSAQEKEIEYREQTWLGYFNRLFLGLGYQFTAHLNAHLGYMYVFQQLPEVNTYVHIDAIRFFVFHNLDFRNQE